MDSKDLHVTCHKMSDLIKKFGRMSLKEVKSFYSKEYACIFPFAKDSDGEIHSFLTQKEGARFDENKGEYFYEKSLTSSTKRKANSPSTSAVPKRSRSAPSHDDDSSDDEKENQVVERQSRPQNKFQADPQTPKSSRSKSDHRPAARDTDFPQFQGCMLIGDNFLIGFAMHDLNQQFTVQNGRLQKGFCVSGLTISMATKKLKDLKKLKPQRALVYLGSFDVINGKELIEMMNEFDEFAEMCLKKKIKAVACTLAPLPFNDKGNRLETLKGFNKYLRNQKKLSVIEISKYFMVDQIEPNERFYSKQLRKVSGCNHNLILWTNHARYIFKKIILENLGQALLDDKPSVHDK